MQNESIILRRGGGTILNFKVVDGTTQPASASENTIWVNTSTKITSWAFTATEPTSPVEGMAWFSVSDSCAAPINVLKKDVIMIYPSSCKQHISGGWVDKVAKTYQSGRWIDWAVYLYNGENSGFINSATGVAGWATGSISYNDALVMTNSNANTVCAACLEKKTKVSGVKEIEADISPASSGLSNGYNWIALSSSSAFQWNPGGQASDLPDNIVVYQPFSSAGKVKLDVSEINGEYFVCIMASRQKTLIVSKIMSA